MRQKNKLSTFSKTRRAASGLLWDRRASRTALNAVASLRRVSISCAFSPSFSAASNSAPASSSSPNSCLSADQSKI